MYHVHQSCCNMVELQSVNVSTTQSGNLTNIKQKAFKNTVGKRESTNYKVDLGPRFLL